jgi:hypothetical protein
MSEAAEKIKRELEPDQAEDAAEEQPAAKRVKTDAGGAAAADAEQAGAAEGDAEMADDAEAAAADDAQAEDGEEAAEEDDAAEEQVAAEPVKLGYRTFKSASEASDYIANILKKAKPGENLNEVRSSHLVVCPHFGVLPAAATPVTLYCSGQHVPCGSLHAVAASMSSLVLLSALDGHCLIACAHYVPQRARSGTLAFTQLSLKAHTACVLLLSVYLLLLLLLLPQYELLLLLDLLQKGHPRASEKVRLPSTATAAATATSMHRLHLM